MPVRALAWHDRHPLAARWLLAGPVSFLTATLFMASMPFVLPAGGGGIDHLVMPVVLFPLIWAVAVFVAVIMRAPSNAALYLYAALAVETVIVASALTF